MNLRRRVSWQIFQRKPFQSSVTLTLHKGQTGQNAGEETIITQSRALIHIFRHDVDYLNPTNRQGTQKLNFSHTLMSKSVIMFSFFLNVNHSR